MASRGERLMRRIALLVAALAAVASMVPAHATTIAAARCSGTAPRDEGCAVKFPASKPIMQVNVDAKVFVGTILARVTAAMSGAVTQMSCTYPATGPYGAPTISPQCTSVTSGLFLVGEEATLTVSTHTGTTALPALGGWSATAG